MSNHSIQSKFYFWKKCLHASVLCILAIALSLSFSSSQSAWGQSEFFKLNWLTGQSAVNVSRIDHAGVKLDGYQLFVLAAPTFNQRFPLEQRVQGIEEELNRIANSNFEPNSLQVVSSIDPKSDQPVIAINDRYLMTVTTIDAQLQGRDPIGWANQIAQVLRDALVRARQERQPQFLINRGLIAAGIILIMLLGMRAIVYWQDRLKLKQETIEAQIEHTSPPYLDAVAVTDLEQQLNQKQRANLSDLQ
ncbi:MAG: hypothetical protein M1G31_01625 [Pseudanabaena sp. Salubria-1]|nr:hypothetical protein [Pseudanabaena sp. Salubria-1]